MRSQKRPAGEAHVHQQSSETHARDKRSATAVRGGAAGEHTGEAAAGASAVAEKLLDPEAELLEGELLPPVLVEHHVVFGLNLGHPRERVKWLRVREKDREGGEATWYTRSPHTRAPMLPVVVILSFSSHDARFAAVRSGAAVHTPILTSSTHGRLKPLDETCPISTGRRTRRVPLVRGEGRDVSS